MLPREHGAYGQLLVPLATVLAAGGLTVGATLLTLGFVAGFLAHEPLLVWLGHRGRALQREHGGSAARRGGSLAAVAAALISIGAFATPAVARWTVSLPIAGALAVLAFVFARREKSTAGEIVAAAALSACAVPVACAAGLSLGQALSCWAAFTLAFTLATLAVRGLVGRADARRPWWRSPAFWLASLVGAAVIAFGATSAGAALALVAAGPMGALVIALTVWSPPARELRRVGWMLVAASITTALVLIAGLR
jgi:hypothetical protein